MIDVHCHLLPEVDDGPKSWEISQQMCHMALADGITHIVATPHANHRYHYDREYLVTALEQLRRLTAGQPQLSLGCDFHLSYDNLHDVLEHPQRFTIGGSGYLLVELSNYSVPVQITDCFSKLGDIGITPVITHPERNPILRRSPRRVLDWVEQGCVVQVTASSVTGSWGEGVQQAADWLLKRAAVHVLATDAHDISCRVPKLSPARDRVTEICGAEIAHALVEENPRAIISGKPLPYFPKPVIKN